MSHTITITPGDGQLRLQWGRHTHNPGAGLTVRPQSTGYSVFRDLDGTLNKNEDRNNAVYSVGAPENGGPSSFSWTDTNVTNGTTYYYIVVGYRSGTRDGSPIASGTPMAAGDPPANAPTGLSGSRISNTSLSASWNAVTGDGTITYRLGYWTESVGWLYRTTSGTSVTLAGLVSEANYFLSVRAENEHGNSAYSHSSNYPSVNLAAPQVSAPSTPSAPSVSQVDQDSLNVSWSAVTGATSYNVQWRVSGSGSSWSSGTSSGTSRSINGLASSTTYEVQIQAVNSGGTSAWSSSGTGTTATPPANAPSTPSAPSVSQIDHDSLSVSWSSVTGATSYGVRYRVNGSGDTYSTTSSSGTSITINGLSASTTYEVQIQARNAAGNSSWSSSGTGGTGTPPIVVPGSVSSLSVSNISYDSFTISWNAPSSGGTPAGYHVQYKRSTDNSYTSASDTTYPSTVTGLDAEIVYDVRVRAYNSAGNGPWLSTTATTIERPGFPLTAVAGDGEVRLSWGRHTHNPGAGLTVRPQSTGYSLFRDLDGTLDKNEDRATAIYSVGAPETGGPTSFSYTDTNVVNGTSYYYIVVGYRSGTRDGSPVVGPRTPMAEGPAAPATPGAPTVTGVDADSIRASWTLVNNATSYNVRYRQSSLTDWSSAGSTTNLTIDIDGLSASTTYQVQIQAVGTGGSSVYSSSGSGSTLVSGVTETIPGTVTSLSVSDITSTGFSVSWLAPTSGGTPAGYHVQYKLSTVDSYVSASDTISPSVITDLNAESVYDVQVRAYNSGGNGAWTSTTATTPEAADEAPGVPINVAASSTDHDTMVVSWDAPTSGDDPESYEVRYKVSGGNYTTITGITSRTRAIHQLTPLTTYQVQVRAVNSQGMSDWAPDTPVEATTTSQVMETAVPSEVLRLTVDARSSGVVMTWLVPEVSGTGGSVTGYNIWRNDGAGWRQIVANTGTTSTSYTDIASLNVGETYWYTVRAINNSGAGKWAQTTRVLINPQVPSAPRRFSADAQTSGVVMNWIAPEDIGTGGIITGYNIWRRHGTTWTEIVPNTSSTSTDYTDIDSLTVGDQYAYAIRAINGEGNGEWSAVVQVVINPDLPSAPRRLIVSESGTSVSLTWLAPADTGFGGAVTGYNIWRYDGSTWMEVVSNTRSTSTSYTDSSSRTANTTYWYTVRAINSAGRGEWSETSSWVDVEVDIDIEEARLPSAPQRLQADAQSSGVVLAWLAPERPGAAGAISGYSIWRWFNNVWTEIVANTNSTTTRHVDMAELEDGKKYWYAVRAINPDGTGEWSNSASAIINPQVPSAPRRLRVDSQSSGVIMDWLVPVDEGLGGAITGYNIWRHDGTSWSELVEDTTSTVTAHTDMAELIEGYTYWYAVRALNGHGGGEWSEVKSAVINPSVPSAPRRFQADAQSSGVIMSWLEPVDDGLGGAITGYQVWRSDGNMWAEVHSTNSTTLFWVDTTELTLNKWYWYAVRATNTSGPGEWSNVIPVLINPTVPSAPRRFQADAQSTGVVMDWLEPFDSGTGGAVISYNIWRYDGSNWVDVHTTSDASLSWTDTAQLELQKTYKYSVRAINAEGFGEWSQVETVLINPSVPSAPRRLAILETEEGIVLSWLAPVDSGTGGVITGYEVWRLNTSEAWTQVSTLEDVLTYTDVTELEEGWYWWAVRAVNAAGPGEWSETSGVTTATNLPGAPGSLTAVATSAGVILEWEAPLNTGGSPITGYKVWRWDGIEWLEIEVDTMSTDTTYTDTMVAAVGTGNYWYRVQAITMLGVGDFSAAVQVLVTQETITGVLGFLVNVGGRPVVVTRGTIVHVGSPATHTVDEETRGQGPYTYEMRNIPPGMTFDSSARILVGTPTTTVSPFRIYYDAIDTNDDVYPLCFEYHIEDTPIVVSIDGASVLEGGLHAEPESYSTKHHGGPDVATIKVVGSVEGLEACSNWIRRPVEIHGKEGGLLWWGYVHRVERASGAIKTSTNLNQYYTSVGMTYIHEFRPGEIDVNLTQWREQKPYNHQYGDIELLVNDEATGLRPPPTESELDGIIRPFREISSSIEDSRRAPAGVVLNCVGWHMTLENQYVPRYPRGVFGGTRSTDETVDAGGSSGEPRAFWVDYPTGEWAWTGNPYLTGIRFSHKHNAPGLGSKTITAQVRIARRNAERPGVPPGYTSYSPNANPDTNDYPEEWLSDWQEIKLTSNPGYGNNKKWETHEIDFSGQNIQLPTDGFYFVVRNLTGPGLDLSTTTSEARGLVSRHVFDRAQYTWVRNQNGWEIDQQGEKLGCDVFLGGDIETVMDVSLDRHTSIRATATQIGLNRRAPQASFALYREGTDKILSLLQSATQQTDLRYHITPDRKMVIENQPNPSAIAGARQSIFSDDVTSDTPGVIMAVSVGETTNRRFIGDGPIDAVTSPIDSPYVTGGPAYIQILDEDGGLRLNLSNVPFSRHGMDTGPRFTTSAGYDLAIAIRLGDGTVLGWRLGPLFPHNTQTTASRYRFPGANLAAAGTSHADFLAANIAENTKRIVVVDVTHSNIDWDNKDIVSDLYPRQSGREDRAFVLNPNGAWQTPVARGRMDFVGEWVEHDGRQSYCIGANYEVRTGIWDISYRGESSAYDEARNVQGVNVADPRQGPGGA